MRRIVGLLVVASAVATVVALSSPSVSADPSTFMDYECTETSQTANFPPLAGGLTVAVADTPDPAKVFQPVTWRVAMSNPVLPTPFALTLHYLRWRFPIPDDVTGVTASVAAVPGRTLNPPRSQMSVRVTASEVVFALPLVPSASRRIRASAGSALTYPFLEGSGSFGNPVVLPQLLITGVPTPAAGATTIMWRAPEIDLAVTLPAGVASATCAATAVPVPGIVGTAVSASVQTCDGRAVTVQTGFNTPTAGDDVIQGTSGRDTANGLGGNDRFCGLAGADTFGGGAGSDRALGGGGNDVLRGDAGDDYLQGDAGRDRLDGGANRDTCNGGSQVDSASGCEVTQAVP